jgi:hypothetical protein
MNLYTHLGYNDSTPEQMKPVHWDANKIKLPDFTLDNILVNKTLGSYATGLCRLNWSVVKKHINLRQLQSPCLLLLLHSQQWFLFPTIDNTSNIGCHYIVGNVVDGE